MLQCLNDDCLVEIFQYLNLKEQVNLTLAHERFRTLIVGRIWRKFHKFKPFSVMIELEELDPEMFLRLLAPNITELTLNDVDEHYFCNAPSLEFYFSLEYPELRKLYLSGGSFQNDYLMGIARTSPKLELLVLDSWRATGEYLCDMPNLKGLFLNTCNLEPVYLKKVFDNQKIIRVRLEGGSEVKKQEWNQVLKTVFPKISKLRYVDNRQELLEPDVLNSSADLFQNLVVLIALDCERSIDFVCSLHTLRVLHLENCIMQMKDLLKVIENNVNLNHLYLYGGLMYRDESMLYGGNALLFRQHLTAQEVCKFSDLRRQQQKNEPCKRLLHIHLYYKTLDLQRIVKDHDSNQGHQEPAIRIVEQPLPHDEDYEPERNLLDIWLKWN